MKNELKYINLLHRDTRNSRLSELSDEIDALEPQALSYNPPKPAPTEQAWLKLTKSLKHSTDSQANRLKKISDIESLAILADLYEKFEDTPSYQSHMLKINKLIRILLIEYTLLEIPVPEKIFSKVKLNNIVEQLKHRKTLSKKIPTPELS